MRRTFSWLRVTLRLLLAAFFLWASVGKLLVPGQFAQSLGEFGILQEAWIPAAAWALIVAEGVTGIGLLLGLRLAALCALGLLIFFSLVLAYGLSIGLDIDCGCFGTTHDFLTLDLRGALIRNLALVPFVTYLWLCPTKPTHARES